MCIMPAAPMQPCYKSIISHFASGFFDRFDAFIKVVYFVNVSWSRAAGGQCRARTAQV